MDARKLALEHIGEVLSAPMDRAAKAKEIAAAVRTSGDYRWAGIYEVDRQEIAAIAWTGADAPAFPRFPRTQGLCGAAVATGKTVAVGDVTKDPRYLTTFGSTRSEIVVPIPSHTAQDAIGLIDVESESLNAFGEADRAFLENRAELLSGLWE